MLKLIALGTLSYLAARFVGRANQSAQARRDIRLAGGPLSSSARLQHREDGLPD